jgi:futalosine hydrolase
MIGRTTGRLLIVTAVEAEKAAVLAGLPPSDSDVEVAAVDVAAVGVGPAAAAAGTARLLARAEAAGNRYASVVSAGIAGGFAGRVAVGGLVLADRSIAADLGADSPDGFLPVDRLGFGVTQIAADSELLAILREDSVVGPVLTVSTVTGTAEGLATILSRYPDAVAESMEGFGVATAAVQAGTGFAEVRAISNLVGPRDRTGWRVAEALATLREGFRKALR